jgi:excisionase family DNA binding protein
MQKLLTENEVAELIGITRVTIWKHRRAGRLRFLKVGRVIRYRPEDVAAFLDASQGQAAAPAA